MLEELRIRAFGSVGYYIRWGEPSPSSTPTFGVESLEAITEAIENNNLPSLKKVEIESDLGDLSADPTNNTISPIADLAIARLRAVCEERDIENRLRHTPEFSFERDPALVAEEMAQRELERELERAARRAARMAEGGDYDSGPNIEEVD